MGYLLHKNPDRVQSFDLSFGKAHVSYPEATNESCTAALLLDVDPVALVRTRRGPSGEGGTLDQYVNDRPYVASSFLSVAIARVLASALGGASKGRTELVDEPLPLVARITVLPCRGGEDILNRLFEPLGYTVRAEHHTSGNVYVVDSSNNVVTEILAAAGYTTVNTLAVTDGNFSGPNGVAVDGSGNLFVADFENNAAHLPLRALDR